MQGGLIDLRYGQACLETQASGHILEYTSNTLFTLNGKKTSADALAALLKNGTDLAAVARFDSATGKAGWLDTISGTPAPTVKLLVLPTTAKTFRAGDRLTVTLPEAELRRLKLSQPTLTVPGVAHAQAPQTVAGGLQWSLTLPEGIELRRVPIYVVDAKLGAFQGPQLSLSGLSPSLGPAGPQKAPAGLLRFPGWVDLKGPTDLLDFSATKVVASGGAKVDGLLTRPGRLEFWLNVPAPGTYNLRAYVKDTLSRSSSVEWTVTVPAENK